MNETTNPHIFSDPTLPDADLDHLMALLRAGADLSPEAANAAHHALRELKKHRERDALERLRSAAIGTHRVIVEGFSSVDEEHAFADGLEKASHYFSDQHDVSITLLGLIHLPDGGYRATLEIHVTPMSMHKTAHREAPDVELKRMEERNYALRRQHADHVIEHHVQDHFMAMSGMAPHVPDFFLINLTDAQLLNHMIEKEFFHAGHAGPMITPDVPEPKLAVRVRKPAPDGTQEYAVILTTTQKGD